MCVTIGLNENLLNNQISTTMKEKNVFIKKFYQRIIFWEAVKYFGPSLLFLVLCTTFYCSRYDPDIISPGSLLLLALSYIVFYHSFTLFDTRIKKMKNNLFDIIKIKIKKENEKYERKITGYKNTSCRLLLKYGNKNNDVKALELSFLIGKYEKKITKNEEILSAMEKAVFLSPREVEIEVDGNKQTVWI